MRRPCQRRIEMRALLKIKAKELLTSPFRSKTYDPNLPTTNNVASPKRGEKRTGRRTRCRVSSRTDLYGVIARPKSVFVKT